jgi:CHASE2 domain-containing sensor protein
MTPSVGTEEKPSPSRREVSAIVALTLLILTLTALLPDQTFVREARNKASDWLISLQPRRSPAAALGRNIVLARVNEGAISRQYPATFGDWKDPPVILDRDHIADVVDRFAKAGASIIVVVAPFP